MAKELPSLQWIEELLPKNHLRKSMFGGFAYYCDEKIVLLMFDSSGSRSHKGKKFDFELWCGCMFPVEKELQEKVKEKHPQLMSHPILPKWLYIPLETEDFESRIGELLKEIRRKNPLFGTIPKPRKPKAKKATKEKTDTRRPQIFKN